MRRLVLIALISAVLMGCSSPTEKIAELATNGQAQIDRGEFEEARATFDEIAHIDDMSVYPVYGSGLVYEAQFLFMDALHEYMMAVDSDPEFSPGHAALCRIYRRLDDPSAAVNAASTYATLNPDESEAKFMLAQALFDLKQLGRARQTAIKAGQAGQPACEVEMLLARSFLDEGQMDSATAHLELALAETVETTRFCQLWADYTANWGNLDSAMALSRKAVHLSGDNLRSIEDHFFRALSYDYLDEARDMIELVDKQHVDSTSTLAMKMHYYDHTDAESFARDAYIDLERTIGLTITGMYFDILQNPPGTALPQGLEVVGRMRNHAQKHLPLEEYRNYLDYMICSRLYRYVDEKTMIGAFETIKAPWANRMSIRIPLAWLKQRVGLFDEAERLASDYEQFHADQPDWLTGVADLLAGRDYRQPDRGRKVYEKALALDPDYRPAFDGLLAMRRIADEPDKELALLEKHPEFTQRYPDLAVRQAILLVMTGKPERGVTIFESEIARAHGNIAFFENMAEACRINRYPSGLPKVIGLLEQYCSEDRDGLILDASLTSEQKQYQAALDLALRALEMEPNNWDASAEQARALFFLGDKEQAYKILEDHYKTNLSHSRTNYWLSRMMAIDEKDSHRATTIARQAMLHSRGDPYVHSNLSFVIYQGARFGTAAGEARRALLHSPNHPLPHFRRGMAQYMDDQPEAKETLKKAIKLGLWGDYLIEAKATLEKL